MASKKPKLPEGLESLKVDPAEAEKQLVAAIRGWDGAEWFAVFNAALLLKALAPKVATKEAERLRDGREIEEGDDEDSAPWMAIAWALGDWDVREANASGAIGPLPADQDGDASVPAQVGAWLATQNLTPKQAEKWFAVTKTKPPAAGAIGQLEAAAKSKTALKGTEADALAKALVPELVKEAKTKWSGCLPWRWPQPFNAELIDSRIRARGAQLALALPAHASSVLHAVASKAGDEMVTEAVQAELALRGWFQPKTAAKFNETKLLTLATLMPDAFAEVVLARAKTDGFFRSLFMSSSLASQRPFIEAIAKPTPRQTASRPRKNISARPR